MMKAAEHGDRGDRAMVPGPKRSSRNGSPLADPLVKPRRVEMARLTRSALVTAMSRSRRQASDSCPASRLQLPEHASLASEHDVWQMGPYLECIRLRECKHAGGLS
jgi:hypothetical protein